MTDYTPTTEMVKTRYAIGYGGLSDDEEDVRAEAFDRWLTEHDRQVAERAWDEGFDAGEQDIFTHETFDEPCIENPYRRVMEYHMVESNGREKEET